MVKHRKSWFLDAVCFGWYSLAGESNIDAPNFEEKTCYQNLYFYKIAIANWAFFLLLIIELSIFLVHILYQFSASILWGDKFSFTLFLLPWLNCEKKRQLLLSQYWQNGQFLIAPKIIANFWTLCILLLESLATSCTMI